MDIDTICRAVCKRLYRGGTVYAIGNGGSCSQASHLLGELVGRMKESRFPIRAVSVTDPTIITCIANDFGYDVIYSRQLAALCTPKDVLFVFTTSGKSENVLKAIQSAWMHGALVVSIVGDSLSDESPIKKHSDMIVMSHQNDENHRTSSEIQEVHEAILHNLCKGIEHYLFDEYIKNLDIPTVFLDIDGTIVKHNGSESYATCDFLDGVINKMLEWNSDGVEIVLTTGRPYISAIQVVSKLRAAGVRVADLVCGLNSGTRYLFNDTKVIEGEPVYPKAVAVSLTRDEGIGNVHISPDGR